MRKIWRREMLLLKFSLIENGIIYAKIFAMILTNTIFKATRANLRFNETFVSI